MEGAANHGPVIWTVLASRSRRQGTLEAAARFLGHGEIRDYHQPDAGNSQSAFTQNQKHSCCDVNFRVESYASEPRAAAPR